MKSSARTVVFPGAVSFGHTLAPLRRGLGDPCFLAPGDGSIWRTSLLPSGPVTARISRAGTNAVQCVAWGAGAAQFVDMLPAMLGSEDDASDFVPRHPTVAAAQRRVPHLRLGRTGLVLEALIPAIIEQRVPGADAFRSWRVLVSKYGTPAPGPAPERMRVPPSAQAWRSIPSWEFHRANVDPRRAQTVVTCARRAASLERLVSGVDVAAGGGGVDCRRDGATGLRRRRRRVGGRLPHSQDGRLDAAGPSRRRRGHARITGADAAASPAGGPVARSQRAGS